MGSCLETAKEKGLIDYINSNRFQPKKGLTRAEAVEILVKTDYGQSMINDLQNWDKGFGDDSTKEKKSIRKTRKK